ncbi:hypothetical protein DPEC_G00028030 [Dallia pectoralis]|uniref:Uncharacterized protein n=1 Tax=Dallia pectoralis TaxID=75939 RepID=A0ACC2HJG6_DALPE|nr:hypothetical protein DPEC_G00028030 [Dallia pectoralis]
MQRGSPPFLSVREEDGEITIGTKIDREKLCEKNLNCSIEFDVITLPTEHLQLFHVEVEGERGKEDAAFISETAPLDTFVALVRVEDLDFGLNGEVVCKLHGQGSFKLQKTYENNYMILTNVSGPREEVRVQSDGHR